MRHFMSTIIFYAGTMQLLVVYNVKEYPIHTVDAGAVKTKTEMESQALGALVQPPGAIMETSPTPPQLTGMLALMLCQPRPQAWGRG